MKTRTGYVYRDKQTGNWYARIGYTKNNGKRSSIKRKVTNKSHGKQVLKELIRFSRVPDWIPPRHFKPGISDLHAQPVANSFPKFPVKSEVMVQRSAPFFVAARSTTT